MTCPCGAPLSGRQRAFCSAACKQRAHRATLRERQERLAVDLERQGKAEVTFVVDVPAVLALGVWADRRGLTLDEALRQALREWLMAQAATIRVPHEPSAAERAHPITERTNR
ncbi:hypothetical protein [Mycobacterium interjectum]|uniref:hypothetical protein n=1 Tax=Mycobacterium interjectum TaxID=33895 RepID=UPI00082E6492|nr:hypothetical protein [Mycobacterium interjectum]